MRCELLDTMWQSRIASWSLALILKAMRKVPWLLPVLAMIWEGMGLALEALAPRGEGDTETFPLGRSSDRDARGEPYLDIDLDDLEGT